MLADFNDLVKRINRTNAATLLAAATLTALVERIGGSSQVKAPLSARQLADLAEHVRKLLTRQLLSAAQRPGDQLDELLRWLSSDPRRWSRLDGTAIVVTPGHGPVTVRPQSGLVTSPAPDDRKSFAWVLGAGIVAAAALGTGAILLRSRRGESGG